MTKGGGGVKNLKKLMTSFMNGPLYIVLELSDPFWILSNKNTEYAVSRPNAHVGFVLGNGRYVGYLCFA